MPNIQNNTKNKLSRINNLPAMPAIMFEVSNLLENKSVTNFDLVRHINKDQGLTAKILSVANSPFYGLPRKVSTVDFALTIIGFNELKNVLLTLTILEVVKGNDSSHWNRKSFWMHSLLTAGMCKRIAENIGYPKIGESFTAGLLHDLGISTIQKYFEKEFNEIYELYSSKQKDHLEVEKDILGMTHEEIGYVLASKWNFPDPIIKAIRNHHNPSESENKVLSSIINLADYVASSIEIEGYEWDDELKLDPNIAEYLKFGNEERLQNYIKDLNSILLINMEDLKNEID
jgi:putative nucleotidyltransferase with HDIG domain